MSGRKLGGGRILGSGRGLAPPTLPSGSSSTIQRSLAQFVPSEGSSASFDSQNSSSPPVSSSPLPDFSQELTSNISLGRPSDGASSERKLVCPICSEEMLTLLQLNRHLDDAHQELPEVQQDEVRSWFDKQVFKAKKFQPLSVINQKLRGLDVFESNESLPLQHSSANGPKAAESTPIDPDDLITKSHWQRPGLNDLCTEPACSKRLGVLNGNVNCRKCGKLFCEEHTMYQMKLSRSAQHEPVRGYWYRVCETCYKSREGYNDHSGVTQDHTAEFVKMRRPRIERRNLEIQRLEKRLTKLTRLLANPPEEALAAAAAANAGPGGVASTILSPVATLTGQKNTRKALEQMVVVWEDDTAVSKCPFCQQEFGSWTLRRHHCRICGRVVCADPQTACSTDVGLTIAIRTFLVFALTDSDPVLLLLTWLPLLASANGASEKSPGARMSVDIRMCRECKSTLFSKRDFEAALAEKPPDQRAYETLRQFEFGIRKLMPSFQKALLPLQQAAAEEDDPSAPPRPQPTHAQIQEAAKIRKRLTDSFTKYDLTARRIRDLKTDSPTQERLQKAIYAAASNFLHAYMLPLKSVPRMLKTRSQPTHLRLASTSSSLNGLSPLRNGELASVDGDAASQTSETSTVVSALETEEKQTRERLAVLHEQRFLVKQMIDNARGAKRVEEVGALGRNLEELDKEIQAVEALVGSVEAKWEGLYRAGELSGLGTPR